MDTSNSSEQQLDSELAVEDTDLSDGAVATIVGDENEAPAGTYQTATQAELEQEYARLSVEFREKKSEYERVRKELVLLIEVMRADPEDLLTQRLASPMEAYELPLPMTFGEIKKYTGWTTQKANSWLKYRLLKGTIKKRGSRGRYKYFYPSDPQGDSYFQTRNS